MSREDVVRPRAGRVSRSAAWSVVVVVPARDEERTLDPCLRALRRAAWCVPLTRPGSHVRVVVVLDSCRDASAEVLRGFPDVEVLEVEHGQVGATRAAGVDHALAPQSPGRQGAAARRTWLAHTDADTEVPPDWLLTQLAHADAGAHAVLGMVTPQTVAPVPGPRVADAAAVDLWRRQHPLRDGHDHVHGANLGVRLDAYDAAGGFRPAQAHEDVDLVRRLRASGARVEGSGASPVVTSARLDGRAPGGFAAYLAALHVGTVGQVGPEEADRVAG